MAGRVNVLQWRPSGVPNTSPTSSAFGKITSKSGNRDMQIARKIIF
jgi:hypothetical protein